MFVMKTKHFLGLSLIVLSVVFIGLQVMEYELYAAITKSLMLGLLTILYCQNSHTQRSYFFLFLVTFFIADILGLSYWFRLVSIENYNSYIYSTGNILYILSYAFLIIKVIKSMNLKRVITKLAPHFVILIILDIFCVTIVTGTAENELNIYQYALEFLYNAVIMTLLTLAVINYIYKVDKRAMNLLIGALFIVFSEVIQLAYYYVLEENNMLNILCSLFFVIAFLFLYLQEVLEETEELSTFREHLEA